MSNLRIYDATRSVPEAAKKTIKGGRLNGYTDINPMWRIKSLTDLFGPCGRGWRYEIVEKRLEAGANGEIAAFVDINLYYALDGEWSAPIPGTGGASFVSKEKNGLYTSDECYKMALTDAISVACKALGMGADVYWDKDRTKYDAAPTTMGPGPSVDPDTAAIQAKILDRLDHRIDKANAASKKRYGKLFYELSSQELGEVLDKLSDKG